MTVLPVYAEERDMGRFLSIRSSIIWICFLSLTLLTTEWGRSAEQPEVFLRGLRDRGYHELALDYLEYLRESDLIADDVRVTLSYQRGLAYIQMAIQERRPELRGALLDQAQNALQLFLSDHGQHLLAPATRRQLGNVLALRARMKLAASSKASTAAVQKKLVLDARQYFEEAQEFYNELETDLRKMLTSMPKYADPRTEPELHAALTRYRNDYMDTRIQGAKVLQEKALTAEAGSKQRQMWLEEAVVVFDDIYQKYRKYFAGYKALFYQAQCLHELGKFQDAVSMYSELLNWPGEFPALRKLKTQALTESIRIWTNDSLKDYAQAITTGEDFVKRVRSNEARQPEWLELRMELAQAHRSRVDALTEKNPADPAQRQHRNQARSHAKYVSRSPGPLRKQARQMLAELGEQEESLTTVAANFATFDEARAVGLEILEQAQTASTLIKLLDEKLSRVENEGKRKELLARQEQSRRKVDEGHASALRHFRRALVLVPRDRPADEVNTVRYYLAFLLFQQEEYFEAVVLAEFVCRSYPDDSLSSHCAGIALSCYAKLLRRANLNNEKDAEFEVEKLRQIATYTLRKWPRRQEGQNALVTLVDLAVQRGEYDEAEQSLNQIAAASPLRGEAELKTGRALFHRYRQMVGKGESVQLLKLRERTLRILEDGTKRVPVGQISLNRAEAVLSLASLHLDAREPSQAIRLLENEQDGSLTLVQKKHPFADREGFAEETYRTVLRAYTLALGEAKTAGETGHLMRKVEQTTIAFEGVVGDSAESRRRLVGIYVSLAQEMQNQIKVAPAQSRVALSKGLANFLQRISAGTEDTRILHWAAGMFYELGSANAPSWGKVTGVGQEYYEDALQTYQNLLNLSKGSAAPLEPQMFVQIQLRLAMIQRSMGEFQAAIEALETILRQRNAMLDAQVEAARTYQAWAEAGDPRQFEQAIHGKQAEKGSRQKVVWGWGTLASKTQNQKKYSETFHKSRYNLAFCRYRQALSLPEPQRAKGLSKAKRDIAWTQVLRRDLGGDLWKAKYDQLLTQIEQELARSNG